MKAITIENGVVKINSSVFIIPNSAAKINTCIVPSMRKRLAAVMTEIGDLNGFTFNHDCNYMIECWYHSQEMGCDNIPDHSINCTVDGKNAVISVGRNGRYLPENLFEGHKEGDTLNVKIPASISIKDGDKSNIQDIILEMDMKLEQLPYRYGRFGPFEEVLKLVTR